MNTDMRSVRIEPPIYKYSRGFSDSAAEGNTDPGYHMEIEEVPLDGLVHSAQASETHSIVSGERASCIYQEISDSHLDFPQAAAHEEVLNMNTSTNYPSLWDGIAEESSYELKPKKDNPSHDKIAVSKVPNVNSMNENGVKLRSIAKAAGETTLVDEDIHEGRNLMVAVENDTYADQPGSIVKAAEGIVLMDNDIHESSCGIVAMENEALDNDIYQSDGGMVGIENEAYTDRPINVVKSADEIDLMDNEIYESSGGMVAIENEAHEDEPISMVKSADEIDLMDNEE